MKNGQPPIHIQRWAPADFQTDEHVRLLYARRDWRTLTFYRTFLDVAFMRGGDLPADPEALAASLSMPRADVVKALSFCVGRLLREEEGRLYQGRVKREIARELEFRESQAEAGRKGGTMAGKGRPLTINRGSPNPPSPTPLPLSPAPSPVPFQRAPGPANPLIDRVPLERECLSLVREVSALTGDDPVEVIAQASGYKGAATTKINPMTMSDDRLANTVRDLRADVAELRKKGATSDAANR